MCELIDNILTQTMFKEAPPVLVDVGASYHIYPIWKRISAYSICLAFDPDIRETDYLMEEDKGFLKLYTLPYIVTDEPIAKKKFYLTNSPYCSSTLPPNEENLGNYKFRTMFGVQEEIELAARTLTETLKKLNLNRIDWLKTDTQGTDLRIFESLSNEIKNGICAIDFEPGIVDAYQGEDKLHHVLNALDQYPFWVSDLSIHGVPRVSESTEIKLKSVEILKRAPCWSEVTYLNKFVSNKLLGEREFFLGWIFSTLLGQHGFGAELAIEGMKQFNNQLFESCFMHSNELLIPNERSFKEKVIDRCINLLKNFK